MSKLQGVIPAAGKGVRARPYTHETHKGMLDINGSPNIQRIIEIMRDQLDIERIVIIVGYLGDSIREHFSDGQHLGVEIEYVENVELDKGLAWSILLAQPLITSKHFCIMLCDECYIDSNHSRILQYPYEQFLATCCGLPVDDNLLIQRNYAITFDSELRIKKLEEKPRVISSNIMGTGTFICDVEMFEHLKNAFEFSGNGFVDFVSTLNAIHQKNVCLGYFQIEGTYVNINDRDSLYQAKYYERIRSFSNSTLGLIIYAEGNEDNINFTVQRYAELNVFNSISIVTHSGSDISSEIDESIATVITCPKDNELYGERLKYAMELSTEDIIILAEADYSFPSRDVEKLLTYLPEADMVIGTRTTRQLIEQGSTMQGVVRLANAGLGRLVELLWWNRQARFTDVGCTFRAIWRTSFDSISDNLNSTGPEFSAEMMIALLNNRQRVIEVPVNYFNRSQSIHRKYRTVSTFFRLLWLILRCRISSGSDK
ncbi:sugar phosphate nucleotidyltransferase [Halioglobus sp.]|nr:sugar phosphate nucleotidyltransferase [Halioglobus sp.]